MDVQVESLGDVVVIKPTGTLDASNSKKFKQQACPAAEASSKVLVDLSGISVIDSSGLAVLLSLLRQVNARGGDFKLCAPTRAVRTVLELVRMHRVIDTLNDRAEALRAFSGPVTP